jgi:hypothetical protein
MGFSPPASSTDGLEMLTLQVCGSPQLRSVPGQWRLWKESMLMAFGPRFRVLSALGLTEPGACVGPAAVAAAEARHAASSADASAAAAAVEGNGTGRIKWAYLQHLQQHSSWLEAAAAFNTNWPNVTVDIDRLEYEDCTPTSSSSSGGTGNVEAGSTGMHSSHQPVNIDKLHADALQLCRALVAAAPLPLVCNNLSCNNFVGSSETQAAAKVCAGCRCRYCSAACQAADWRQHRTACKSMVAAELACR